MKRTHTFDRQNVRDFDEMQVQIACVGGREFKKRTIGKDDHFIADLTITMPKGAIECPEEIGTYRACLIVINRYNDRHVSKRIACHSMILLKDRVCDYLTAFEQELYKQYKGKKPSEKKTIFKRMIKKKKHVM